MRNNIWKQRLCIAILESVPERYPALLYQDAEHPLLPKGPQIHKHLAKGTRHRRFFYTQYLYFLKINFLLAEDQHDK